MDCEYKVCIIGLEIFFEVFNFKLKITILTWSIIAGGVIVLLRIYLINDVDNNNNDCLNY